MLRATWKLQLLTMGIVGAIANVANGDEATKSIVETITNAFGKDDGASTARSDLIEMCGKATLVLAILFFCYIVASAIGRFIGGLVTEKVDVTLGKFLNKAIRNVIMLVVGMLALNKLFEIEIAGFAAIIAAVGFAVGMALQGTLGNFAAGVMLLAFRPFKVDDYIVVAGAEGTVEEIDLFTTRLNALDNRHVIIPNGEIFGAKLENYSRNPVRRVDVNVGASYAADLQETRQALEQAISKVESATAETKRLGEVPKPQVYLRQLGGSSVDWQLRVWCHPKEYWGVREQLTAAAKESLDQAGISIPFPQMDVHVVGKVMTKSTSVNPSLSVVRAA